MTIPPAVLSQYESVTARANQTAQTPFSEYSGQFVAPTTATQNAGIANTNAAANEAQPYYGAATAGLGAAQSAVNPVNAAAEAGTTASSSPLTGQQIDSYLSPYLNEVMGSTSALLGQQNEQAQAGQLGNAIRSGAFGGDRTGIAAANLNQQNQLASANILSGIANQGYQSALGTAQGQQQIGLAGAQQLAGIGQMSYGEGANTSSQLAVLGSGAQTAGLQGAQAQIGAGTVQQQTQQAQDTAEYQQFLQKESYPFQVDQFLANVSEGVGALSGSTTTTTQPGGFFSDERLKEDMEPIGKTFDGQPIYRYKMRGDSRDRIGLSAQEVEKKHPEAVGLAGGFKYVDYGRATEAAANRAHFYEGGVVPFRRQRFADGGDTGGGLDAVLAAQQRMYAPQGGGGQRNIPSQGVSHQLAVAQGTPQPGPSGEDKTQQTIGLGKDAYSAYKYFYKPSPGPDTGLAQQQSNQAVQGVINQTPVQPLNVSGNTGLGAQPAGTTTYFGAPAEEGTTTTFDAGLSAADTTGAAGADAAASGAAEGAAAEGAASAGAGAAADAAGTAAVAGATDAAATEAAVLAAEYAAADIGTAALIAAKRGGRIGLAAGGDVDPYSEPDGGLVIPDQEVSNEKLQSAGPLVKQPTGLQTAMKMGDMNNWSSMAGSMFSNQGMATGGLAGRRGYDDGGTPDDSPDASSATNSPAPAADTSTGVAPPKDSHWWQKSENILPILSGLAAMGTAKTVHPGVALAAGLGAGADSYLSTRASQAKTAEEQQKATGQGITNQLNALKLKTAKGYLDPSAPVNPYAPAVESSPAPAKSDAAQATADGVDQMYRNKYQTTPWTPDEQAAMQKARGAAIALGTDQPVQQAQTARDQRVQNQTYTNQKAAQVEASQLYKQATDPQATQPQRDAALVRYNAIRQWTGDTPVDVGGQRLNSRMAAPEIGSAAQVQTLGQKQAVYARGMTPVTLGNDLPGFEFQKAGFKSIDDYVAANPGGTAAPSGAAPATSTPVPPSRAARTQPAVVPSTTSAAAPAAPPPTTDPYLSKALSSATSDPKYRETPLPRVTDNLTKEAANRQQAFNIENRQSLLKNAAAITSEQASAKQYLSAAKQIMESKGAPVTGVPGAVANWISEKFNGVDATNYQEVSKNLINAAVQQGHSNFPNATQSEFATQTNKMSPSEKMTPDAIKHLIDVGLRTSDYMMSSAGRATTWAKTSGLDPLSFNDWNQQHYPREKIVNTPTDGAVPVKSRADVMKLKPGTVFITPDGRRLVR